MRFKSAQITLRFDGSGTTGSSRRDRLLVNTVGDIAGNKNSWMFTFSEMFGDEIPLGISLQFAGERLRVRIVSNGYEDAGYLE